MLRGTADMYVGMSALHRERNDLDAARQLLLRSQELGEHTGLPQNRYRWRVAMARVHEAEGDLARRARPARRGGAPVRGGLRPQRAAGPGVEGTRVDRAGEARLTLSAGPASRACPPTTTSATCASSSTSPWRGCCWRSTPSRGRRTPSTRQSISWSASCTQRRRGTGRAASSRSWCCRRSPTGRGATTRRRWCHSSAPCCWRSRRATSAGSLTRADRWRPCSMWPRSVGSARPMSAGCCLRSGNTRAGRRPTRA